MKTVVLLFGIILAIFSVETFAEPVQEKGILMQMLPERAAMISGRPPGLYVDYADYLAPESRQPMLRTPVEFVAYVEKQDPEVQKNGVWILLFNPAAYSDEEELLLEKLKSAAHKSDIPLFFHYATDLEGDWRRQ